MIESVAIAVVAFLDDLFDWPIIVKFGAQVSRPWWRLAAAFTSAISDFLSRALAGRLGRHRRDMTWLLFTTNAMNYRGLNGLASGVALIACLFIVYIAERHGAGSPMPPPACWRQDWRDLPFNFPGPASSWAMSEASSAASCWQCSPSSPADRRRRVSFLLMPMLLAGVLFDVAFTFVRRSLAGEPCHPATPGDTCIRSRSGPVCLRWAVTLVHWGFADVLAVPAACCLSPRRPPTSWRRRSLPWSRRWYGSWFVVRRARLAGVSRWG